MDEYRLDGNAAAGPLREVFAFEPTAARYACERCEKVGVLAETMVYEVRGMGTILRCPGCDNALIRLSHTSEQRTEAKPVVDLRGITYLQID